MSPASRGLAPHEGPECLLVKMGCTKPLVEPRRGPQAGKSGDPCRCQNRRISGRGSRTMHLGSMVTGGRGHDVYPGSGPLDGGNTLHPACLILMI